MFIVEKVVNEGYYILGGLCFIYIFIYLVIFLLVFIELKDFY